MSRLLGMAWARFRRQVMRGAALVAESREGDLSRGPAARYIVELRNWQRQLRVLLDQHRSGERSTVALAVTASIRNHLEGGSALTRVALAERIEVGPGLDVQVFEDVKKTMNRARDLLRVEEQVEQLQRDLGQLETKLRGDIPDAWKLSRLDDLPSRCSNVVTSDHYKHLRNSYERREKALLDRKAQLRATERRLTELCTTEDAAGQEISLETCVEQRVQFLIKRVKDKTSELLDRSGTLVERTSRLQLSVMHAEGWDDGVRGCLGVREALNRAKRIAVGREEGT